MTSPHPDLHGYYFEDLTPGMSATVSRTFTDTDLRNFTGVSGDTNPMHLNDEYARSTPFGGVILHGMLTASLISTVIGTKLPGPGVIYMSQSLKFLAPVRVGDTVYATCTIKELFPDKKRALISTHCSVRGKNVIEGEALVKVPSRG